MKGHVPLWVQVLTRPFLPLPLWGSVEVGQPLGPTLQNHISRISRDQPLTTHLGCCEGENLFWFKVCQSRFSTGNRSLGLDRVADSDFIHRTRCFPNQWKDEAQDCSSKATLRMLPKYPSKESTTARNTSETHGLETTMHTVHSHPSPKAGEQEQELRPLRTPVSREHTGRKIPPPHSCLTSSVKVHSTWKRIHTPFKKLWKIHAG